MYGQFLLADIEQIIKEHHLRIVEIGQAFAIEHDHLFQAGHLAAHLKELVELFVILDEQERRARVVDEIGKLFGAVSGIDPRRDAPDSSHAQIAIKPLAPILGQDLHRLPLLQTQRQQRQADAAGAMIIVAPGIGLPDTQLLFAVRHPLAHFAAALCPEPDNRVAAVQDDRLIVRNDPLIALRHAHLHVLRRFQRFWPRCPASWRPR